MTRSTRRGPWLPEEDQTLLQLVRSQGPNNWVRISQYMQHRSPKQCRERFHQNLKPSLNHEPISAHEGEQIEHLVQEMGKRWAEIARRLGNRSDNAVKNWWNGSVNRRKRNLGGRGVGQRDGPISATKYLDRRVMPPPFRRTDSAQSLPETRYGVNPTDPNYYTTSLLLPRPSSSSTPNSTRASPDGRRPRMELRLPGMSAFDRPAMSPTTSEASYSVSLAQPPSLVSDNHSSYSISPRTVASPRPVLLAPIDHHWTRRDSFSHDPYHAESFKGMLNPPYLPCDRHTPLSIPRDSRMNVSRLLA